MKELQSLDDIFNKRIFRIPDYQRGYAWREKQLVEFWDDLLSLDNHRSHYTGVLSIKAVPQETIDSWNDETWLIKGRKYEAYYVVDGQQRLTTVSIFIQCLVESVKSRPENSDLSIDEIYLGAFSLKQIIEDYLVITEPRHKITHTYKFGYETDNPSFEFLRHRIFNQDGAGTLKETFYTLNLENAKKFFKENIADYVGKHGVEALEELYEKLTQRFLFNLYEIDDSFDVFVAFETMNNRGKRLSDLELLKNRLIYLTTLYTPEEVSDDVKVTMRTKINDAWGEVYNQLGRNKNSPLNDNDFLRAHWIMYFKYSRNKGNDYIHYLLDDYFSPKNVLQKLDVSLKELESVEEILEDNETDDELVFEVDTAELKSTKRAKRNIKDISQYVESLKGSAKIWYATFFPADAEELSDKEKLVMDKINRVKIGYFRPLIMACLLKTPKGDQDRLDILNAIERFVFLVFRICRTQSNYRSSAYYRAARSVYFEEIEPKKITEFLNEDLDWAFYEDGTFDTSYFENFIKKKFGSNGDGFYGWNDLRYFLFEYEETLKATRGVPKLGWENFTKHKKDRLSIEHIYPQTADSAYWAEQFGKYNDEEQSSLRGSLGNLLPLSSSINSSLQNDDFPDKKNTKRDETGKVTRNGYTNGSYSELEVADNEYWTAENIKNRGLKLLEFMEKRWDIDMGSDEDKLALLHLSFLEEEEELPEDEPEEALA